ncbi:serine/threonine-protein kinase 17a [Plakobranchus ocellatus]|uniref:Serine/threonine-protein kinase 17a n=1 Tax=Plakobranchus ocellatus TaxID=259542 RepID=A0AAV4CID4_9GAST|nr:serine/threonine-protein kinase 17a [Plakobranchus ocellatus]
MVECRARYQESVGSIPAASVLGKFAVVRKCVCLETGEVVAAKVIRKRRKGKSCREEILREVVMLELAMAHPRLVSLREVFETQSELILVTEYCSGGELFDECVINESFKEDDVRKLLAQILEGLAYLHDNNIVHLDLKPQNILLTKPFPDGDIKICDLGFACLTNTGEDIRDIIGTPDYVAPEVLDYEPLNIQTDMWSLGVLTYVMLTACSPFAGDNQQETFCNITQVKMEYPDELFENINPLAKDFISKLLVKKPRDRMTARQCLDHPWLANLKNTMIIQVPTPDHSQELANDMIIPSNWHMSPDRKFSVSTIEAPVCEPVPIANGRSLSEPALVLPVNGGSSRTSVSEEKDSISSTLSHIDIDKSSCTSFETCPEASDTSPSESTASFTSTTNTPEDSTTLTLFANEVAEYASVTAAAFHQRSSASVQPLLFPQRQIVSEISTRAQDSFNNSEKLGSDLMNKDSGHLPEQNVVVQSHFPTSSVSQKDANKLENSRKRMSMEIPPKRAKCIEDGDIEPSESDLDCLMTPTQSGYESTEPSSSLLNIAAAAAEARNGLDDLRNAV